MHPSPSQAESIMDQLHCLFISFYALSDSLEPRRPGSVHKPTWRVQRHRELGLPRAHSEAARCDEVGKQQECLSANAAVSAVQAYRINPSTPCRAPKIIVKSHHGNSCSCAPDCSAHAKVLRVTQEPKMHPSAPFPCTSASGSLHSQVSGVPKRLINCQSSH